MICKCPQSGAISSIPNFKCSETFGQVQKIGLQRLYDDNGRLNFWNQISNNILSLPDWETFLTAEDSTKIVISPYIQAPTAEAGAARTFGGGNETLGGVEEIIGEEPTPFTGVLRKVPQNVIKVLKRLECESKNENLGIYLFDQHGAIGALQDGSGFYYPIPIRSFFVGSKTLGGLEAPDSNAISWQFLPEWSLDLVLISPLFNPLTALINQGVLYEINYMGDENEMNPFTYSTTQPGVNKASSISTQFAIEGSGFADARCEVSVMTNASGATVEPVTDAVVTNRSITFNPASNLYGVEITSLSASGSSVSTKYYFK